MRGVAALLVVICHARIVLRGTPYEAFAEHALSPGALGVDLFFMISGFIMVYATRDSDGSCSYISRFLLKRLIRIWPVYVTAILIALILPSNHITLIAAHTDGMAIIKSMLFLPIDGQKPPFFNIPYGIGWTLNFEVYFYLVFAASMLLRKYRWVALTAWFIVTLIGLPLIHSGHAGLAVMQTYGFKNAYVVEVTNPIIWEFLVGVAIGLLYLTPIKISSRTINLVLVACTVIFAFWYDFSWRGNFNGLAQWGLPLVPMFLSISVASKSVCLRIPKMVTGVGKISYSLYLFHPISITLVCWGLTLTGLEHLIATWGCAVAIVPCAIAIAYVANRFLEDGLSGWIKKKLLPLSDRLPQTKSSSTSGSLP